MANNKDFVVAGAVEVGKDTKVTLGTVTSNDIDLATGNYFADTPTGASTYTISNAGDVQSFQLEVTGGTAEVAQNFSTTLYDGTSAAQTITNDIDLSGDGGMVWIKSRTSGTTAFIYDTERGATESVTPSDTNAEESDSNTLTSFSSDGFSIGSSGKVNSSTNSYVSWAFKKEPSFFDVVTYTGNGANRSISHSLGSELGMIIIKRTDASESWIVYHRSAEGTGTYWSKLELESTGGEFGGSRIWGAGTGEDHTDSTFFVSNAGQVNASGGTYVAYLFAHDDAADGLIQCGSYTGGGSTDVEVNLGWQPQWLLIRRSDAVEDWFLVDSERGFGIDGTDTAKLKANSSEAETTSTSLVATTPTGFKTTDDNAGFNSSGGNYIYMAIRAASDPDITWPSSIEWTGGSAPSAPAVGETDVFTITTDDGGTTYVGVKTADNLS